MQAFYRQRNFHNQVMSFGFKRTSIDADVVMDVRFLQIHTILRVTSTRLDEPVYDYVMSQPRSENVLSQIDGLTRLLNSRALQRRKIDVTIAIGWLAGGQHRSVAANVSDVNYYRTLIT